jgi:hypothetical protein
MHMAAFEATGCSKKEALNRAMDTLNWGVGKQEANFGRLYAFPTRERERERWRFWLDRRAAATKEWFPLARLGSSFTNQRTLSITTRDVIAIELIPPLIPASPTKHSARTVDQKHRRSSPVLKREDLWPP